MPRSKGIRLYLKPAHGTRVASWIIRDGARWFCGSPMRSLEV